MGARGEISHSWSYNPKKYVDRHGMRWHFVHHMVFMPDVPYEERPDELYFRDDAREQFGVHRIERKKDNRFRDYETRVRKILNGDEFRETLLDPETRHVWRRAWLKWSGERRPKKWGSL
jgi:hypothetical protein